MPGKNMKQNTAIERIKNIFQSIGYVHTKAKPAMTPGLVFLIVAIQFLTLLRYFFLALLPGVNASIVNIAVGFTVGSDISWYKLVSAVSVLILYAIYNFLSGSFISILSQKANRVLYNQVYGDFLKKTAHIKYLYFNSPEIYENISLLKSDISSLVGNIYTSGMIVSIIGTVLVIIYTFAEVAEINLLVGFLLLFANSSTVISTYIQTKKDFYAEVDQIKEKRWGGCYSKLLTSTYTAKEIRLYSSFDYIYGKWQNSQKILMKKTKKLLTQYTTMDVVIAVIKYALLFVSIILCIADILKGRIPIDSLMLVYTSHTVLDGKLSAFFGSVMTLKSISFRVSRWKTMDSMEAEPIADSKKLPVDSDQYVISVEHLTYRYENADYNAVDDVSFTVGLGEKVGIVGENGSGKTTLVHLILGLLTPKSGSVKIKGENLNDVVQAFRNELSVLFQDFCCYQLSVRDNIRLGDLFNEKSDNEIEKVAEMTKTDLLTNQYETGLDTKIGSIWNNGVDFSGGQRQRIGLSRLYTRAESKMIMMDEPTSALDPVAETELYSKIISDFSDKGMILVTHRLGFMNHLDKIIVMQKGRIVDIGNHAELMERCNYYNEMYRSFEQYYKV